MPTAARSTYSADARSVLTLLNKRKASVWDTIAASEDSATALVQGAVFRATAAERKQIPITAQEKLDAFKLIGYEPTPKQLEIAMDPHRVRIVRAGRRSGKTLHAAHEAVAVMLKKPGSMGWVVAPDYDLTFRCWEMMVGILDRLEARGLIKFKQRINTKTSMRIVLDNGSIVEGQSCENADDLQGVGLDWLVIDEIAQVLPFVFLQMIYPALSERGGWAFLIGTPIGENWTEKEYRRQVRQAEKDHVPCAWSEHMFQTWCNTKMFPGGRYDPKILDMARTMPFEEYMEQVCAEPQKSRYVTYKEFNDKVHVRTIEYDHRFKVQLSIDPSTGVNPYAVAVFQDLGGTIVQIDEYYRISVTYQDVIEELRGRPWWEGVEEAIIDDNWPQERENWRRSPHVHFSVRKAGKSSYITDTIPIVRAWLRDPVRWNTRVAPLRDSVLAERYEGKTLQQLDIEDQHLVMLDVESRASSDLTLLQDCARFFVDRRCTDTISEVSGYLYKKRKRDDQNPSEAPAEHNNHVMDCWRYFIHYRKKRWADDGGSDRARPYSYLFSESA